VDPKRVVEIGYDAVSFAYRADDAPDAEYGEWLSELAENLPARAKVLDLGCGCGVPATRWLVAHGYDVTGVDLSSVQIQRARELVPKARFICADMSRVRFPPRSFDAVIALYSLIHLPLTEQEDVIRSIHTWLQPGGPLLAIVGAGTWTGTEDDWLGAAATMWWSHAETATYLRWLSESGFHVVWNRFVAEDDGGHNLVLAGATEGSGMGLD
jgi:SAM-dependent methyltransferase